MNGAMNRRFNVRVYGLLIKNGKILLSDERIKDFELTKFPGGGLEFGEGTVDCIIREMREETGGDYQVTGHFYTTDFFQVSAFNEEQQIISIYYLLAGPEIKEDMISDRPCHFQGDGDCQNFRWVDLEDFAPEQVTFPIDKKVVELLRDSLKPIV